MHRIALLVIAVGIAATNAAAASRDTTLALVAYSTPKEAFAKVIPAFQATPAGRAKLQSLESRYVAAGAAFRPAAASLITYLLVYEREHGLIRS